MKYRARLCSGSLEIIYSTFWFPYTGYFLWQQKKHCMNMNLVPTASYYAMRVLSVVTHSLVICSGANTVANTTDLGDDSAVLQMIECWEEWVGGQTVEYCVAVHGILTN